VALAFSASLFAQPGKPEILSQVDAEAAVQQFETEFMEAYNRNDAKAVAALFIENGTEFGVFGDVTQGREEIARALTAAFALPVKFKTAETTKVVLPIAADVIVAQGASLRTREDGGGGPSQPVFYTKVLVRHGARWLIAAVQYGVAPSTYVGKDPARKKPQ
jgi:uncharacterized protein (TIGR02246 family)